MKKELIKKKNLFILLACAITATTIGLAIPKHSIALSGSRISNTPIRVYTKQGNDWFLAIAERTDGNGVLKVKDVLPGKYKMEVSRSDKRTNQSLAVNLKMLDKQGRKIRKKMDVDLYIYINDNKVFIGTVQTDEDGWLKLSGLSLGSKYLLDIGSGSYIHKKYGELRIKTKTKIDNSDWFQSSYERTKNNVLEEINVLPGKYKFRAVNKPAGQSFILHIRLLNKKGKKARNSKVKIYAYINNTKKIIGEVQTDNDGWVSLPGVLTGMTYKIRVLN